MSSDIIDWRGHARVQPSQRNVLSLRSECALCTEWNSQNNKFNVGADLVYSNSDSPKMIIMHAMEALANYGARSIIIFFSARRWNVNAFQVQFAIHNLYMGMVFGRCLNSINYETQWLAMVINCIFHLHFAYDFITFLIGRACRAQAFVSSECFSIV